MTVLFAVALAHLEQLQLFFSLLHSSTTISESFAFVLQPLVFVTALVVWLEAIITSESLSDFRLAVTLSTKNLGGLTPFFSAQSSFSSSVWQQQLSQQVAAELQLQGQFSQGYRSSECFEGTDGRGTPIIQKRRTGRRTAATRRTQRAGLSSLLFFVLRIKMVSFAYHESPLLTQHSLAKSIVTASEIDHLY